MAFDVRVSGEHAKIVLSGDVDLQTTADLKSEIQNITDVTRLEIEAGDVTYIDSSGVAVLLLARQHCAQNNIALSLPTISDAVFRVLQIAKLDVMLPIGQVVNSSDAGLMGLGNAEDGAPAADDDLVSELLAGDDSNGGDDDAALAARLLDGRKTVVLVMLLCRLATLAALISGLRISRHRPRALIPLVMMRTTPSLTMRR